MNRPSVICSEAVTGRSWARYSLSPIDSSENRTQPQATLGGQGALLTAGGQPSQTQTTQTQATEKPVRPVATGRVGNQQRQTEGSAPEVARGITEQSGELNGLPYNRRADSRDIPPTPKALAEFANNLENGDLLIDKFGNERGIVAKAQKQYVKLVNKDTDSDNTRFEEYSLTSHLPKEKGIKQTFSEEYDKLNAKPSKAKPADDLTPDVSKIKQLNPETAKEVAAEVAEQQKNHPVPKPDIIGHTTKKGKDITGFIR